MLLRTKPTLFERENAVTCADLGFQPEPDWDDEDEDEAAPAPPSYSNYANSQVEIVNRLLRARRVLVGFFAACARVKRFARLYVVPHYRYKPGKSAGFKRARAEFEQAAGGTTTDDDSSKRHKEEKEAEAQAGATEGGGADDK